MIHENTTLFLLLLVVISTLFIAGCAQQLPVQPTPQPTAVKPASTIGTASSPLGTIRVDAQGKTLYYSQKTYPRVVQAPVTASVLSYGRSFPLTR